MPTARSMTSAWASACISTSSTTPSAMCASLTPVPYPRRDDGHWRSRSRPSAAWTWSLFCRTCRTRSSPSPSRKGHYRELLNAGVKIYEYTPGFVHAKVFCQRRPQGRRWHDQSRLPQPVPAL
ncbi:MAG: hypothetical protein ACLUNO_04250 [Oscillospiraceae bacterium]